MWYHWAILLVALYFTATSLYNMFKPSPIKRSTLSYTTGSIQIVILLGIAYWAYSSATAPPPMYGMTAGRRRH
jgi:hypothetical protein